jgi:hypothetical protein
MGAPSNYRPSQLPRRFPVGATYVVEGVGGAEGHLRVIARYVVLPGGRRINIPALRLVSPIPSRNRLTANLLTGQTKFINVFSRVRARTREVRVVKYEPDGPMARLLKFLVLFVSGMAILHKLKPWGLALF